MRWLFLFFALLGMSAAYADDGWMIVAGDAYQFGKANPNIQMATEDLRIDLRGYAADVAVSFTFVNHGPAVTVTMGFPESRANIEGHGLHKFRSWVDGKPVRVERRALSANKDTREYEAVWLKKVSFTAHGRRKVVVKYRVGLSGNAYGSYYLDYILATATSWKMPIQRFKATVDWSHLKELSRPEFVPAGALSSWKAVGSKRRFIELEDFTPKDDISLTMRLGFWNFIVNGKRVAQPELSTDCVYGRGSDPWVQPSALKYLFHKTFTVSSKKLFDASGRAVSLRTGVKLRSVIPGNEPVPHVRLKEVVGSLGGTFQYRRSDEQVEITVPRKR